MANSVCCLAWPWGAQIKRFGCVYDEIRFWVDGLPMSFIQSQRTWIEQTVEEGGRCLFFRPHCLSWTSHLLFPLVLGLGLIALAPWFSVLWTWTELYCQLPWISNLQTWVFLSQNLLWGIRWHSYGGWQDPISVRGYTSILFLLFLWRTWRIE